MLELVEIICTNSLKFGYIWVKIDIGSFSSKCCTLQVLYERIIKNKNLNIL